MRYRDLSKINMATHQDQYDDAMFAFSTGDYDTTIAKLKAILAEAPDHFDAQLSLGMAFYRKGDYARAIAEGHQAEKLKPNEQLVHTNLSLFYMKNGDKKTVSGRSALILLEQQKAQGSMVQVKCDKDVNVLSVKVTIK